MFLKKFSNKKTLLIVIVAVSFLFYAFSTGITGKTKKSGQPGCTCHSNNPSTNVLVNINGPDTLKANQEVEYTVTISGGTLTAGGTNIAVSSGTLTELTGLQKISDELTHISPKSRASGNVTFNFKFKAPANTGQVTLYANGNSVNLNGSSTGDQWNYANDKIITIIPATSIDDINKNLTFHLSQNYPNPFNPNTKIKYQIAKSGLVSLKVFDILGKEIATLVDVIKNAGAYEIEFSAHNLPSGIYFYQLRAGDFVSTKKFVLMK